MQWELSGDSTRLMEHYFGVLFSHFHPFSLVLQKVKSDFSPDFSLIEWQTRPAIGGPPPARPRAGALAVGSSELRVRL